MARCPTGRCPQTGPPNMSSVGWLSDTSPRNLILTMMMMAAADPRAGRRISSSFARSVAAGRSRKSAHLKRFAQTSNSSLSGLGLSLCSDDGDLERGRIRPHTRPAPGTPCQGDPSSSGRLEHPTCMCIPILPGFAPLFWFSSPSAGVPQPSDGGPHVPWEVCTISPQPGYSLTRPRPRD